MAINKRGFYSPWGYIEENDYQSSENQFEAEVDGLLATASYNKDDKKIHFFNKDGDEVTASTIDTTEFVSGVIESATYDKATKILTITFSNGDVVEINLADLIDENEFADGLQVNDGIVSILLDASGEPYISVSENGLKAVGIDSAIETAVETEKDRAVEKETAIENALNSEISRAISAETDLQTDIDAEVVRATAAEETLDGKIDDEASRARNAESTLTNNLTNEINRAKDEENTIKAVIGGGFSTASTETITAKFNNLSSELDDEKTARATQDNQLQNAIATETTARQAGDTRIENLLNNEINRAAAAEAVLTTNLATEVDRAKGVESTISGKIDTEIARATEAESDINDRIDNIVSGDTPIKRLDELIEKLGYKDNDTLVTTNEHEVAFGEFNISNTDENPSGQTIFSIGIGENAHDRKNAVEVRKDGSVYMWVEGEFMDITKILAQISHEVYEP